MWVSLMMDMLEKLSDMVNQRKAQLAVQPVRLLLGGIIINCSDKDGEAAEAPEDYFQPLMFQSINAKRIEDLYKSAFRNANKRRQ
jgi:hypothetical protein